MKHRSLATPRHALSAITLAALTALAACGGGDPPLSLPSGQGDGATDRVATRGHGGTARAAVAAAAGPAADGGTAATPAFDPTTYDPAQPDRVTVGTIVVGDTRYHQVLVRFGALVGIGNGQATRTYDHYDPATNQLTVASVTVGGTTYTDVVVTVAEVLGVGRAAPVAPITPDDPLFKDQWHLHNTGQASPEGMAGQAGEDLNVRMAWNWATGTGVRIAVIDDGIDVRHPDLQVVAGKSWDYRVNAYGDPSSDKSPHGTSCAGLAAATGFNGIGVTGVAYRSRVVGYNLLSATTGEYGADAVVKDLADNHVYSNSYGSTDSNGLHHPSDAPWREAIDTGTRTGRGGKGAVYTWAAGNGAPVDRSDYDGQANYQGVLAIGSLNGQGKRSSYSEPGANLLVMGFGGEQCNTHTTTTIDVTGTDGYNNGTGATKEGETYSDYAGNPDYTRCMNGTSAATPQATGVVALLLETNPALGWRDVRAILARTARKNDPGHADWLANGAGWKVNHEYGYGALDATAAVKAAQGWQNLPAQKTAQAESGPGAALPDAGDALVQSLSLAGSGITRLEFVDLTVDSDHPEVGDLEIVLTSPAGTPSTVSVPRSCMDDKGATVPCGNGLAGGFRFGIARLMDEAADGTWRLSVRDTRAGQTGRLVAWRLKVYGH